MRPLSRAIVAVAFCILTCGVSHAQVAFGTPVFGTVDSSSGRDTVDLANLNVHIQIPVLHKAGRGLDFTYDLGYDNSIWYPGAVNGVQTWIPDYNWGWRGITEAATGYLTYTLTETGPDMYGCYYNYYQNWVYHDGFGVPHAFPSGVAEFDHGPVNECGGQMFYGFNETTPDGSGYTLNVYASSNGCCWGGDTLYDRNGRVITVPNNPPGGSLNSGNATDRNGNFISVNTTGQFTDTLGTTALTVTGSGTPSSPLTFAYTPPSGSASYKLNYTTYTVATNFANPSIHEHGATAANLVSSVSLADGTSYKIYYEATPSTPSTGACTPLSGTYSANCVTGRMKEIDLPTGGKITYAYSGGNNGAFGDGSTAGLTRTTPDGTWSYSRSQGSGAASTDVITDPLGDVTTMQFQGIYQTQRTVNDVSLGLLETVNTCYNGASSPCTGTAVSTPISSRTATTILPGNFQSQVFTGYNSYGQLVEEDDYDWHSGSPGSLLRKKLITIQTVGTYQAIQTAKIQDGSGNLVAETQMTFDETTPTATSGTPQHQNPTVGRGNPTTVNYYRNSLQALYKKLTYFDTGNVASVQDENQAITTFNYSDVNSTCGNSFPTSETEPVGSMAQYFTWSCPGGVLTQTKDENGQTVSATYNDTEYWRPAYTTDQQGNQTNFYYQPNSTYCCPYASGASLNFNNGSSIVYNLEYQDGLGRTYIHHREQAPNSSNYDTVSYTFDANGRPNSVSMPCTSNPTVSCSTPKTTTTYDALNRPHVVTDGGGGTTTYTYSQNDVLVTVGPKPPSPENVKQRQLEYDGLGRLTSVCEITAGTTAWPGGTCGQTNPQTGYWTTYTYDANGNLKNVTQNAQSTTQQPRTYGYDLLSRLIQETNPESGVTTYYYDLDGSGQCSGTSGGDLVKVVDAAGNVICNTYDALHRLTSSTYPAGPYASATPSKYFVYDAATVNNQPMGNVKARLAEAYTCFSPCSSKVTDLGFSFTARGEISDLYQSTLHSAGYYHSSTSYWPNGVPNTVTGPGGWSMSYNVEGEGRVTSATGGGNYLTGTSYNPAGQISQIKFSSGDSDTYSYDPQTGRMTQYQFNVGSMHQAMTGNLTWNANGSLLNLTSQDNYNPSASQSCNYQHDDLSRISNMNCPGNALQNPGFEGGNVDWNVSGNWSIINNASNAQSGSWYMSGSATSEANSTAIQNGSIWIPVTPGELVTFGGWIKRVGGTGVLDWGCVIVDSNHNWAAWCPEAGSGDGSGGTSWQLYSAQITVPSNGAYVEFFTEIHGWGDTDTSLTSGYFDSAFIDGAPIASQQFSYDAFGNINKSGSPYTFNPSYSSSTNRMYQIGSCTPSYDADGDVLSDCLNTYTWDANGRPLTINNGVTITYDALGRMVEQNRSGAYTEFGYSTGSQLLQVMNGQSAAATFVPLVGGVKQIPYNGGWCYTHADWLGSARMLSCPNQTVAGDVSYAPFGDTYASSGSPWLSFTGMDQDTSAGVYDFPAREYGIQGRWPSPDPAGSAAADPTNPQSWNRYAYAMNNPLVMTDPSGNGPELAGICATNPIVCAIGFFGELLWGLFSNLGPPPQAPPAPPGGYGAGIDPYGTWDEKLPAGVQALPSALPGLNGPSDCTYGSGACGGVVFGATSNGVDYGSVNSGLAFPPGFMIEIIVTEHLSSMSAAPSTPWYKNACLAKAAGNALLHGSIDALGLVPVLGGEASDIVGFTAGLIVNDPSDPFGNQLTGAGSAISLVNKSIEAAKIGGKAAKLVPVLGQVVSAASLIYDGYAAYQEYETCMTGGN